MHCYSPLLWYDCRVAGFEYKIIFVSVLAAPKGVMQNFLHLWTTKYEMCLKIVFTKKGEKKKKEKSDASQLIKIFFFL